jgi:hypothetical protein
MLTPLGTPEPSHRRCKGGPTVNRAPPVGQTGQRGSADCRLLPGGEVITGRFPAARRTQRWEKWGRRCALARMAGTAGERWCCSTETHWLWPWRGQTRGARASWCQSGAACVKLGRKRRSGVGRTRIAPLRRARHGGLSHPVLRTKPDIHHMWNKEDKSHI